MEGKLEHGKDAMTEDGHILTNTTEFREGAKNNPREGLCE